MKLSSIRKNPNNPRIIKDDKFNKLKLSIETFPKMMSLRPIVIDQHGTILGGNMRYEAIKALGYKEIPDEWVKIAAELTPDEQRRFVIEDNVGFGEWDWDMLANEWDAIELDNWGLDLPENSESDETYTSKVEAPIYEPKKEKPNIEQLYDKTKYDMLVNQIQNSGITKEEKEFLEIAAQRHIVFHYDLIAEYYSHSGENMQEQMENSALVIIDYQKAIENGFVELFKELKELSEIDE